MTLARMFALGLALTVVVAESARAVSSTTAAPDAIQFVPQGSVKRVRQATARFPHVMVALGDPRAPSDPFTVDCGAAGTARWIDSRTWSYDFTQDLPAGLRCRFTLKDGVRALDGTAIAPGPVFAFDTGGPTVRDTAPYEGSRSVEEDQAFILALDAEVDPASIPEHVGFEVTGVAERIAARVVSGAEHDAILKTSPSYGRAPHVVVRAAQSFPNGARVTLVWGAGVATTTGVPTTAEQRLAFQARPAFTVDFSCLREQRGAACNPVGTMRVDFSAPVARLTAEAVALVGADGAPRPHAKGDPDANLVSSVSFPGPFPENATFRVELPAELRRRERARADQRRPLSAHGRDRRAPAARQVQRALRHRRVEGGRDPPRHAAEPRARGACPRPCAGHDRQRAPDHARARGRHPAVAASRRHRQARGVHLRAADEAPEKQEEGWRGRDPRADGRAAVDQDVHAPEAGRRAGLRGGRHPLRGSRALRRRARERPPRRVAARQAAADVRADGGARHQPLGALRVGRRAVGRLGDDARRRAPGRGRRGHDPRLQRRGRPRGDDRRRRDRPHRRPARAPRAPDLLRERPPRGRPVRRLADAGAP